LNLTLYEKALRDDVLPRIPKHVLLYLIFRCDETNTCYASQAKIAKQLRYSRPHVSQAISFLRKTGVISTQTRGKILTYDLSPYVTCHPGEQEMLPRRTGTCNPREHRTSIELANLTSVGTRKGKVHYSADDRAAYAEMGIELPDAS
jgi:hypothetical protein